MDRYDYLYEKYRSQMSTVISDGLAAREEFQARFASKLEGMHLIELQLQRRRRLSVLCAVDR